MTKSSIIDYLQQLDLSEIEAKLYLTLLKTGPINVRELAKRIDVKRTSAYVHIDNLMGKGLIIKLIKGSRKQIAANEPEVALQYLVRKRAESAKSIQSEFPNIISKINSTYPQIKDTDEAEIKFYRGKNGVKKIYTELLKSKEVRSYVNIEAVLSLFPENAQLFDYAIKNNSAMKMYEIVEYSPEAKERVGTSDKRGRYFYKFLPKHMKIATNDVLIYDGKVSIINLKDTVSGMLAKS